jgi:Sigma-70, region 4
LTRIAMNVALMKVRKHRVSREVPFENTRDPLELWPERILVDSSLGPEVICAKGEQDAALRDAITKLRPNLRKVVELYQLQECSLHETAKVLGISVAAAKGDCSMHGTHYAGIRPCSRIMEDLDVIRTKNPFSRTSCAVPFAP